MFSLQKDVKSDPKVVQEVSAATDYLLGSLGELAVEVIELLFYQMHTCTGIDR